MRIQISSDDKEKELVRSSYSEAGKPFTVVLTAPTRLDGGGYKVSVGTTVMFRSARRFPGFITKFAVDGTPVTVSALWLFGFYGRYQIKIGGRLSIAGPTLR